MQTAIDDCAVDGGFIFHVKDGGRKFRINELLHMAAIVTHIFSCSNKILNETPIKDLLTMYL